MPARNVIGQILTWRRVALLLECEPYDLFDLQSVSTNSQDQI